MLPPLGAHESIAGGVSRAIERGNDLGCEALQIFVKNASQWRGKPLADDEVKRFREAHADSAIGPVVAHASYLINLAATDPDILRRSRDALAEELERCTRLGLVGLVVHPGAHLGIGIEAGLERIAESIRGVCDRCPADHTRILLENTAGQGTLVGFRLAHLATIIEVTDRPGRLGICLDTCHAFAAGYAIDQVAGYRDFVAEIDELFGSHEPGCFHLNDSRYPLGSKRDRHANLGTGELSLETFERLLHEPRFESVPMILETPIGDDGEGHRRDLGILRSL